METPTLIGILTPATRDKAASREDISTASVLRVLRGFSTPEEVTPKHDNDVATRALRKNCRSLRVVQILKPKTSIMSDIETLRQANIKRNKAHLNELGILYKPSSANPVRKAPTKPTGVARKAHYVPPSRTSARIASASVRPVYVDEHEDTDRKPRSARPSRPPIKSEPQPVKAELPAKDLQSITAGWTSWKATGSAPTRDEDANFHFSDHPTFTPNKSPEEMLREGCFGGSYFRPLYSRRLGTIIEDDYQELPNAWIDGLDVTTLLTSPEYDPEINKYKVKCGQSIEEWEASGWIDHQYDVRGWFQWYCRFYMGRRCPDDDRQISRWRKCAGETGRWRRALLKKYRAMGVREVFDDGEDEEKSDVSPVIHQTLFHWASE